MNILGLTNPGQCWRNAQAIHYKTRFQIPSRRSKASDRLCCVSNTHRLKDRTAASTAPSLYSLHRVTTDAHNPRIPVANKHLNILVVPDRKVSVLALGALFCMPSHRIPQKSMFLKQLNTVVNTCIDTNGVHS